MQLDFNTDGVDTSSPFDPLPPGEYQVVVTEEMEKETRARTGSFLSLTLQVQEPEQYRGRLLWDNLNINNPNATAVEIARRQLLQLVQACGLERDGLGESSELLNIPVNAIVRLDKNDPTRNVVKGYKRAGDVTPARPAPRAQQAAPAQQSQQRQAPPPQAQQQRASATPPWMKQ